MIFLRRIPKYVEKVGCYLQAQLSPKGCHIQSTLNILPLCLILTLIPINLLIFGHLTLKLEIGYFPFPRRDYIDPMELNYQCNPLNFDGLSGINFVGLNQVDMDENEAKDETEKTESESSSAHSAAIQELLARTGYKLETFPSSRVYGGPPPDFTGDEPKEECQVIL